MHKSNEFNKGQELKSVRQVAHNMLFCLCNPLTILKGIALVKSLEETAHQASAV